MLLLRLVPEEESAVSTHSPSYAYTDYVEGIKRTLDKLPWERVEQVLDVLNAARLSGRKVFIFGNGGSASTASHMACDLSKNTAMPGTPRLRTLALNDNMAHFSALANDLGYENVFAEQLATLVDRGDVVIAISASGNSPNVVKAITVALAHGATTIGLSGYAGGKLARLVDYPIVAENNCVEQVEDIHLILEHMITTALRERMRAAVAATETATETETMATAHV
jgi:D-sedoheptulose 7-phosphate isomerase